MAHISSLFLNSNDSSIKTLEDTQENKFNKLLKEHQPKQDPEKSIFNYSNTSLSDAEKSFLVQGSKFSIPPKKPNYADNLVNFEFFYRSTYNLAMLNLKFTNCYLHFLNLYLYAKNEVDSSILTWNIVDSTILQSDWLRVFLTSPN